MIIQKHIASTSNLSCLRLARHRHTLAAGLDLPLHHCLPRPRPRCIPGTHRLLSTKSREHQQLQDLALGLRTSRPPDSTQLPPKLNLTEPDPNSSNQGRERCEELSDQEWELRTGRAIYILQETLPTFFDTGLITSVDKNTGTPKPAKSTPHLHIPIIESAASLDFLSSSASTTGSTPPSNNEQRTTENTDEDENIYSPNIRLQYTPPVALPAPFPKTFRLEGVHLYLASSALVRRTMNALYSDLEVTLTKVSVHNGPSPGSPPLGGSASSSSLDAFRQLSLSESGFMPGPVMLTSEGGLPSLKRQSKRHNRDKCLLVRQLVSGVARVSGQPGEWEVESLYTFSPVSGLVMKHTVNSIQPAPHIAVYDLLKTSLGQVFGFGGHSAGGAAPTPSASAVGGGTGCGR